MRPVSVSTALFDGYPMALAVEEIARAGARFVEPAFIRGYVAFGETDFQPDAAAALGRLIADAGLAVAAVSAHLDLGLPEAPTLARRRLAFARALGAGILVTNSAPAAREAAFRRTVEAILPEAEALDVTIALENPGHGNGDLIGGAAEGLRLVESIGSPFVRLNYDFGNVLTYSREALRPETDFEIALPALVHAHLKDVASEGPDWRFTALGEGAIDYAAILRRLAALAPDLPVGIELPLRLERRGRADPVRAAEPLPLAAIRGALARSLRNVEAWAGA